MNYLKQLQSDLINCYTIGKLYTSTTFAHVTSDDFTNLVIGISEKTSNEDFGSEFSKSLESELKKIERNNIYFRKKEQIEKSGSLLAKLALNLGMEKDTKKFDYINN